MELLIRDPDSVLDYSVDWSALLGDGETLVSASWLVPAGLTLVSESLASPVATVWLSGGTVGQVYRVTSRVVTSGGRQDDRSFTLVVMER